jgi:hypothetical protein
MQLTARVRLILLACGLLASLISSVSCRVLRAERLLFEDRGIRVGLEGDPTSGPSSVNAHLAQLTAEELRGLLERFRVSGWTGAIAGLLVSPPPIPVFKEQELQLIVGPLAQALQQADPSERAFFSIPDLAKPYRVERTAGAVFLRGRYLYLVLTDHSAFTNTDTGGGEERDPRDTKGMTLFVAPPLQPASVEPSEEPRWGPFEKVHIAIDVKRSLAALSAAPVAELGTKSPRAGAAAPEAAGAPIPEETPADLRLQLRELTYSNLELRRRLLEQAEELQKLKEELARLRQDLEGPKTKTPRSHPSP